MGPIAVHSEKMVGHFSERKEFRFDRANGINMEIIFFFRICDGDPDCVDGADENVTLHHCAKPQPCGEDMFTCENGRCINKVSRVISTEWDYM